MKKKNIFLIIGIIILAIIVGFLSYKLYKESQKTEKFIIIIKDENSGDAEKYLKEIKKMNSVKDANILSKSDVENYADKKLKKEFANETDENSTSTTNYGELLFDYVEDEMKAIVLDIKINKMDKAVNEIKEKDYVSHIEKTNNEYVSFLKHTNRTIQVFFKNDTEEEKIKEVYAKFEKIDGIKTIERKTKEDALKEMKEMVGDAAEDILKYYEGENNIFPESIIIKVSDFNFEKVNSEVEKLKNENDCIEKYNTTTETINTILNILEK